jgi:hypothetical protein
MILGVWQSSQAMMETRYSPRAAPPPGPAVLGDGCAAGLQEIEIESSSNMRTATQAPTRNARFMFPPRIGGSYQIGLSVRERGVSLVFLLAIFLAAAQRPALAWGQDKGPT